MSFPEAENLIAGPEPSAFGKYLNKIKDLANEWVVRPYQVEPEVERITRVAKEAGRPMGRRNGRKGP